MDFTSILKTICPFLGTALGGPLGGLAVEAATNALGLDDKTSEGLKNALAGVTQEDILKLKQAEQEFQVQMTQLGFKNTADLEAIAAGDRASARDMQKTNKSWVPPALSVIVTGGFFALVGTMMFGLTDATDSQALLLMLGSLTTAFGSVMAYWFGTSHGSESKTQLLAQAQPIK